MTDKTDVALKEAAGLDSSLFSKRERILRKRRSTLESVGQRSWREIVLDGDHQPVKVNSCFNLGEPAHSKIGCCSRARRRQDNSSSRKDKL